jgi:hypothetical protein
MTGGDEDEKMKVKKKNEMNERMKQRKECIWG